MNITWEDAEKILNQALKTTLAEINEEDSQIGKELDKAWNRGADTMKNNALILFIQKDKEETA